MRALEIIVGLILAVALFIGLKVLGLVLKFALIAALIGFVVGNPGGADVPVEQQRVNGFAR